MGKYEKCQVITRLKVVLFSLFFISQFVQLNCQSNENPRVYLNFPETRDTLFFDDFTSFSNYWLLGIDEENWIETIEDGNLFFQSLTDKPKEDLIPVYIDTNRDFEIETRIQFVRGDMSKAYGLQWGKSKNPVSQYDFFISANGQYTIDQYVDGFHDFVPFSVSNHVNRYAFNKLTIRKVADSSYFFLNEVLVHSMPFQPFFGNLTGIQVAENSTILVDYFKVLYLTPQEFQYSKVLIIDYSHSAEHKTVDRSKPVRLVLQLKNAGNKKADHLKITYNLPFGIDVTEFLSIQSISPGETKEVVLQFLPTADYTDNEVTVSFDIQGVDITNSSDIEFIIYLSESPADQIDRSLIQTYSKYRGDDPMKGLNVAQALHSVEVGEYYALIIGIGETRGEWLPLRNAVRDAKSIETILRGKYQFHHIKTLYDEEATRQNIIEAFEWLMANVNVNDNLLIYYSGHGDYNIQMEKGFWVPVDAETKRIHNYISNDDIRAFISGIISKHTLLITDACFGGDIFRGKTLSIPYENSTKYYQKVYSLASRKAMTSGGIEPVLDEGKDGHSIFGYYLIKTLQNNQEKYLDASQLYNAIKIPVINNSYQTPMYSPVHRTGDEGGQFIFIGMD